MIPSIRACSSGLMPSASRRLLRLDELPVLLVIRQELVKGRVEQADRHRQTVHGTEDPDEVIPLERPEPLERGAARCLVGGHDHLTDDRDPIGREEHVLRTDEPDTLGAELARPPGVLRGVGVGAHAEPFRAVAIGPGQELADLVAQLALDRLDGIEENLARPAVHGDPVTLTDDATADLEDATMLVHDDFAGADHAGLAHPDGDDGRVRSPAAARGHDALRGVHAGHVLRRGLRTNEDDLLVRVHPLHRAIGVENRLADRRSRGGGQATGQQPSLLDRRRLVPVVENGPDRLVHLLRPHPQQRGVLVDHVLVHEVAGHLDRGARGSLAGTRLQEVQRALLHRELDVLHVLVVPLEAPRDLQDLVVDGRHPLVQSLDRQRRPDSGDDVLALGVGQELGVEAPLPGPRIAREADARPRGLAEVPEDHGHHGHRGAPFLRHVVDAAVFRRLLGEPGVEHGVDREPELLPHVLRKGASRPLADDALEDIGELAQLGRRDLGIGLDAEAGLRRVELGVEDLAPHAQDHASEHHDKASIAVPREPLVARARSQTLDRRVVQAEIEDRLHHPGHGHAGPRADGDQEWTLGIAEAGVGGALEPLEILERLVPQLLGPFVRRPVVVGPGLGRDGESRGYRNPEVGHLGQLAALAAQEVPHEGGAFRAAPAEEVDVFRHGRGLPPR